jgi:DNA invertase Pin-like site-specific DNA recombinase
MDKTIRWAIYARKSTESADRQIQSINDQINNLKALAERESLKIVQIIQEAKSAKEPYKRDGFTELMKLVEQGKITGLLVWKMDRFTREPLFTAVGRIQKLKSSTQTIFGKSRSI